MAIDCVVIPSRGDRNVRRCVQSYVLDASKSSHKASLVVLSQVGSNPSKLISGLHNNFGVEVLFFGPLQRASFAKHLSSLRPSLAREIGFGLGIHAVGRDLYGANRNAAQLLTVGMSVLSADADTYCNVQREDVDGLQVEQLSAAAPGLTWQLKPLRWNRSSRLGRVDLNRSLLDTHSAVLDNKFDTYSTGMGIAVCCNGVAGDPGMEFRNKYIIDSVLDGKDPATLWQGDVTIARHVTREARSSVVTRSAAFMTTCYSFDNRIDLPPFIPRYRGEDGLFFQTLISTNEKAAVADLALTVDHLKPGRQIQSLYRRGIRLSTIIHLITRHVVDDAEGSITLSNLGAAIEKIVVRPGHTVMSQIKELIDHSAKARLQEVAEAIEAHAVRHPELIQILNHEALSLEEQLRLNVMALTEDLEGLSSVIDIQTFLAEYGRLLCCWSEIRQVTQRCEGFRDKRARAFQAKDIEIPLLGDYQRVLEHMIAMPGSINSSRDGTPKPSIRNRQPTMPQELDT